MRARRLLPALFLGACATAGAPPALRDAAVTTIEISQADAGKAVHAAPGQTVAVRLDENPLTGYRWAVQLQPAEPWQLLSSAFSAPRTGLAGAGGSRTWLLQAAHPGKAQLRFDLRRPWGEDPPVKHLEFELVAE